jgi:hypothetical protein
MRLGTCGRRYRRWSRSASAFTPLLRRRLKLVAAGSGKSLKALAAEALDALCRQHDM